MDFRLITDKSIWDKFVAEQRHAPFLQSYNWGEFQRAVGRRVWRVGVFEGSTQVGAAQVIEHHLGLGWGYLYCPKGPIWHVEIGRRQAEAEATLLNFIKEKIANYSHLFLRIEPTGAGIAGPGFSAIRIPSIQPNHLWLTDLSVSTEDILQKMHQKTRYNIHLSEKKELNFFVKKSYELDKKEFEKVWNLFEETAKRDRIKLHPQRYYKKMLEMENCFVGLVSKNDLILAGGIFIGFGNVFTYMHGASSNKNRELMAPYFLHFQVMQSAKAQGYKFYDWGGVNPDNQEDFDYHPRWEGISRFKRGFGGELLSGVGTYNIILNPLFYRFFNFLKKVRCLI